jgi:hypothetical protein
VLQSQSSVAQLQKTSEKFNAATIIYSLQDISKNDNLKLGAIMVTIDNKNYLKLKVNVFEQQKLVQITDKEDYKYLFIKIDEFLP